MSVEENDYTNARKNSTCSTVSDNLSEWSLDYDGLDIVSSVEIDPCNRCMSETQSIGSELSDPSLVIENFDNTLETIHEYSPLTSFRDSKESCDNSVFSCDTDSEVFCDLENTLDQSIYLEVNSEGSGVELCSADSRPSTGDTVVTMAPQSNKEKDREKFMRAYHTAVLLWEDTYDDCDGSNVVPDKMASYIQEVTSFINDIREIQVHFRESPAQDFGDNEEATCKSLRLKAKQLRTAVELKLVAHSAKTAAAAAAASAAATKAANDRAAMSANSVDQATIDVAKLTLDAMEPMVMSAADSLLTSYEDVRKETPTNPSEYKKLQGTVNVAKDDYEKTLKQLEGLKKEAVTAKDKAAAARCVTKISALTVSRNETDTHIRKVANDLGFIPGQVNISATNLDLKPPKFSGKVGDGHDFFTFLDKLDEYFDAVGDFSNHAKFVKLKNDCLLEPASNSIRNAGTYDEALVELRELYGQPRLLFNAKVKEIKKLGKCPDQPTEVRNWAIDIRNDLRKIGELAVQHNITSMFDKSNLLEEIESLLKPRDLYKYRDRLRDQEILDPSFDINNCLKRLQHLLSFLQELIDLATFDIRLNLPKLSKQSSSNSEKAKVSDKPASKRAYLTGKPAASDESNNDQNGVEAGVFSNNVTTTQSKVPVGKMCRNCEVEHTHLSYCPSYQKASKKNKFRIVCGAKACPRCLRMDANFNFENRRAWFNLHKPYCVTDHLCLREECAKRPPHFQNNVTLCPNHGDENHDEQDAYLKSLDQTKLPDDASFYFNSHGMYHQHAETDEVNVNVPEAPLDVVTVVEPDVTDPAVYMLQVVPGPKEERLLVFYDSGCYMAAMSHRAFEIFDTTTVRPGPTKLRAAGDSVVDVEYGDERFLMPLTADNKVRRFATITALHMDEISSPFPTWPLAEVWSNLQAAYDADHGDNYVLPTVENEIGGTSVDVMIGAQYSRYFPKLIYSLPSGLGIYEAQFKGSGGHQGVLGGPSALWRNVTAQAHFMGPTAYLISELRTYRMQCMVLNPLVSTELKENDENSNLPCCQRRIMAMQSASRLVKDFLVLDDLGSDVEYRCSSCRNCYDCKNGEQIEQVSLQEEAEQWLVEKSVEYDAHRGQVVAKLPFLETTVIKLTDNFFIAKKVLESQIRQVHKRPGAVEQVEKSHEKLRSKGFVMKLEDLPPADREAASQAGYFIPWRTVQSDSISTPTRMVFDASSKTRSGSSLNCLLAKGRNLLAEMLVLLFRFRFGGAALCADVSMAYNGVLLHRDHLRYQKYLWTEQLAVGGAIIIMVVLTLIYGVRPAGNLTMQAFKLTADEAEKDERLKATGGPKCLRDSSYMDDILAAFRSNNQRDAAGGGLTETLDRSKMSLKAITVNGSPPDEKVSTDQQTVNVVGYVWTTVEDYLSLDIKPLFIGKKVRGRRPPAVEGDVKEALRSNFTRRELAGKIAAIYDPLGICTPVTARMKLCLREVVKIGGDWDDPVPESMLDEWVAILGEIQELKEVKVPRSIVPEGYEDGTRFELLTCTDSSQLVAVAAVYLRVIETNGVIHCGLMTAKSKLISKLTVPRAELRACTMGASLTSVVLKAVGDNISRVTYVTDSAVALTWLNTDQRPLQVGVRNNVIQIRRFCDTDTWFHIPSAANPADIGTRKFAAADIMADSVWQKGHDWMRLPFEEMPVRKLEQLDVSKDDKVEVSREVRNSGLQGIILNNMEEKVGERYSQSCYIVDPCSRPWPDVVRRVAVIQKVAQAFKARGDAEKLSQCTFSVVGGKMAISLGEQDIKNAETYFFKAASQEVRKHHNVAKLRNIIDEDDILKYSGRILDGKPGDPLHILPELEPLKFVCPVVDRWSPVAYSIMIYAHVTLTHHGGVRTTLRAAENIAFVLEGKNLAKEVRDQCAFCRRYKGKLEKAVMGRLPEERMTIAPAFYNVQIDLFGPVNSHCAHGRRSVVKTYGVVFKCCTTLAVAVFCMDGYDSRAFLDCFYRFSCRYGLPAKVYIDAGAQLLSAFANANFDIIDIANSLNTKHGVKIEFEVCPVNSHEAHGLVERSIREVKRIFDGVFGGIKMDILRLETVFAWVANELNSLPVCLGGEYRDLDHSDLITPNRLILGRSNRRVVGGLVTACQPGRVLMQIEEVERAWWQVWVKERLRELVPRPAKWADGESDLEVNDVVVFVRDKNDIVGCTWRVGMVEEVERGGDGVARAVTVKYKQGDEKVYRRTRRSVRHVAILSKEGELDLPGKLSEAARKAAIMMLMAA